MNKDIYNMNSEERKEYFDKLLLKDIEEIKELLKNGTSKRDILLMNEYNKKALEKAGVGVSSVVPRKEPQSLYEELDYSIPNEGKFEYCDGVVFIDKYERDSLLLYLLGNAGLERTVSLLPEESKKILKELLNKR